MAASSADTLLAKVFEESKSITLFLDAVFGFLKRNTDFYIVKQHAGDTKGFSEGFAETVTLLCMRRHAIEKKAVASFSWNKRKPTDTKDKGSSDSDSLPLPPKLSPNDSHPMSPTSSTSVSPEKNLPQEICEDDLQDLAGAWGYTEPKQRAETKSIEYKTQWGSSTVSYPPPGFSGLSIKPSTSTSASLFGRETTEPSIPLSAAQNSSSPSRNENETAALMPETEAHPVCCYSNYTWSQTPQDLELQIELPDFVSTTHDLRIERKTNSLSISLRNNPEVYLLKGQLYDRIRYNSVEWTMVEHNLLFLHMGKKTPLHWENVFIEEESMASNQSVLEISREHHRQLLPNYEKRWKNWKPTRK